MASTLETMIENYRRGDFRRYHLFACEDVDSCPSVFVGGFDRLEDAREAAGVIQTEADELVRCGHLDSPRVWLRDSNDGTIVPVDPASCAKCGDSGQGGRHAGWCPVPGSVIG